MLKKNLIPTPPTSLLASCIDCVRIGDLLGLHKLLNQLNQQYPEYTDYFTKLNDLANQFRIGEIKVLLNMTAKPEFSK